jgi:hypothetical protein
MAIYKNSPPIVTNGLSLHIDFSNPKSYAGTGATVLDLSGNNYSGTSFNSPTYFSGYLSFNGTNQYLSFPAASSGSTTGNFTFGGWYNNGASVVSGRNFLFRGNDGSGNGQSFVIGVVGSNPNLGVVTTVPSTIQISANDPTTTFIPNRWYYLIGTWVNGVSLKLYVNGILKATTLTTNTSLRTSTIGWVIGKNSTTYYPLYTATTSVYNRALSDTEILQNYNATKSRFGLI